MEMKIMKTVSQSPVSNLYVSTVISKVHRQISEKRCFEKYCSRDKACQFSAQ